MVTMTTSAEQLENRFDVHLPDHLVSNEVDATADARLGEAPRREMSETRPGNPAIALLVSPNLRAAIAIGFFLAYLATALT